MPWGLHRSSLDRHACQEARRPWNARLGPLVWLRPGALGRGAATWPGRSGRTRSLSSEGSSPRGLTGRPILGPISLLGLAPYKSGPLGTPSLFPHQRAVAEPPELSRLKCAGHHQKGNTGSNALQTEQFLVCRVTSRYNHRFSDASTQESVPIQYHSL